MFKQKPFHKSGREWTEEGSGEIQWKAPTPEEKKKLYIGKRQNALVKPEGSTYAGARSAHRIHGEVVPLRTVDMRALGVAN